MELASGAPVTSSSCRNTALWTPSSTGPPRGTPIRSSPSHQGILMVLLPIFQMHPTSLTPSCKATCLLQTAFSGKMAARTVKRPLSGQERATPAASASSAAKRRVVPPPYLAEASTMTVPAASRPPTTLAPAKAGGGNRAVSHATSTHLDHQVSQEASFPNQKLLVHPAFLASPTRSALLSLVVVHAVTTAVRPRAESVTHPILLQSPQSSMRKDPCPQ